jgi:citrate lyase subunit beta/citryl-CoA lyase|tara:strand:- start:12 stop:899 length:888 start_codon:yes stop_codon:yes gene_type:complete
LNKNHNSLPIAPLFVPGNRQDMLNKVINMDVEWVIPDLEDSVPLSEKEYARDITKKSIINLINSGKKIIPRINSFSTSYFLDDLESIIIDGISGISIGKIQNVEEILKISELITIYENKKNIPNQSIGLLPWIENAEAVINSFSIFKSSSRILWSAFGAEDFCADMDILKSDDIEENTNDNNLLFARSNVSIAARAAGVHILDTPYTSYKDQKGLSLDIKKAKSLGYKGKFAIHPSQVEVISKLFRYSDKEILWAEKILLIVKNAEKNGVGAIGIDGKMIDAPVVKRAKNILDLN